MHCWTSKRSRRQQRGKGTESEGNGLGKEREKTGKMARFQC